MQLSFLIKRLPLCVAENAYSHVDLRANFVHTDKPLHPQAQGPRAAVAVVLGLGPTQRLGWPVQLILYGPLPELGLRTVAALLCCRFCIWLSMATLIEYSPIQRGSLTMLSTMPTGIGDGD